MSRAILAIAAVLCCATAAGAPRAIAPATILVVGDSLSAEYGLPRDTGWVKLLADQLAAQATGARKYSLVNASISGETTSGGRTRLPALLAQHRPAVVVIELGANDGLRGLPIAEMHGNLRAMAAMCRAHGAHVLLIGMRLPPNYGPDYARRFAATFAEVAREEKAALVPFLFDGFAARLDYFQPDRIHPNERAQPLLLATVWPKLRLLLH